MNTISNIMYLYMSVCVFFFVCWLRNHGNAANLTGLNAYDTRGRDHSANLWSLLKFKTFVAFVAHLEWLTAVHTYL